METKKINLSNLNEETLFIIGNGFDRAHNIQSSYKDFRNWLQTNRYQDFVTTLENLFPTTIENEILLWSEFEKALGIYYEGKIHDNYFPGIDTGFLNQEVQLRVPNRIKYYIDSISSCMKQWAEYIDRPIYEKVFSGLSPNYKYLSFNYTSVLEKSYSIPSFNICHIHGCAKDNKVIVGHNQLKGPSSTKCKTNREGSKNHIIELMNTNIKPVKDIINNNKIFFNTLSNITKVVVVGHSLALVDIPYFEEIARKINPKSRWYFCVHSNEDEMRIQQIIHSYPFSNFLCTSHRI